MLIPTGLLPNRPLSTRRIRGVTPHRIGTRPVPRMTERSHRSLPAPFPFARMCCPDACCVPDVVGAAVFVGTTRQILGLSGLRKVAPFVVSVDPPSLVLSNCGSDPAVTAAADRVNPSTAD